MSYGASAGTSKQSQLRAALKTYEAKNVEKRREKSRLYQRRKCAAEASLPPDERAPKQTKQKEYKATSRARNRVTLLNDEQKRRFDANPYLLPRVRAIANPQDYTAEALAAQEDRSAFKRKHAATMKQYLKEHRASEEGQRRMEEAEEEAAEEEHTPILACDMPKATSSAAESSLYPGRRTRNNHIFSAYDIDVGAPIQAPTYDVSSSLRRTARAQEEAWIRDAHNDVSSPLADVDLPDHEGYPQGVPVKGVKRSQSSSRMKGRPASSLLSSHVQQSSMPSLSPSPSASRSHSVVSSPLPSPFPSAMPSPSSSTVPSRSPSPLPSAADLSDSSMSYTLGVATKFNQHRQNKNFAQREKKRGKRASNEASSSSAPGAASSSRLSSPMKGVTERRLAEIDEPLVVEDYDYQDAPITVPGWIGRTQDIP
ncbi:hypothetical protein BDZ89DRAFT_1138925 [Hymenopellis radicata]|nr:hypothetical protein BDZ89DRAFT_1138925 [Hymenopellis radicata]